MAGPVKPATLATTRLAEHWAHGLDITGPLGIDFPDTESAAEHRVASAPDAAVRVLAGRRGASRGALLADGTGWCYHVDVRAGRCQIRN